MLYANLIKEFKHLCLSKVSGLGPPRPVSLAQFESNSFIVDYFAKYLLEKCTMQSQQECAQVETELGPKMFETIKISLLLSPFPSLSHSLSRLREHWQQY